MEQNFGGDATDVQAGSAEEGIFLDNDRFQAKFTGANRCYVAARTASDDRYIVLCHCANLPSGDFLLMCGEIATNRRRPTRRERLCTRKQQSLTVAWRRGNWGGWGGISRSDAVFQARDPRAKRLHADHPFV